MSTKHLRRLHSLVSEELSEPIAKQALFLDEAILKKVSSLLSGHVKDGQPLIVIAPGAADQAKRWSAQSFSAVAEYWHRNNGCAIVFVGDQDDRKIIEPIQKLMQAPSVSLAGKLSLGELGALMKQCLFACVNDSSPMHMASYLDVPVLALFGPTSPQQYGPWGKTSCFIQGDTSTDKPIETISVDQVLKKVLIQNATVQFQS